MVRQDFRWSTDELIRADSILGVRSHPVIDLMISEESNRRRVRQDLASDAVESEGEST